MSWNISETNVFCTCSCCSVRHVFSSYLRSRRRSKKPRDHLLCQFPTFFFLLILYFYSSCSLSSITEALITQKSFKKMFSYRIWMKSPAFGGPELRRTRILGTLTWRTREFWQSCTWSPLSITWKQHENCVFCVFSPLPEFFIIIIFSLLQLNAS